MLSLVWVDSFGVSASISRAMLGLLLPRESNHERLILKPRSQRRKPDQRARQHHVSLLRPDVHNQLIPRGQEVYVPLLREGKSQFEQELVFMLLCRLRLAAVADLRWVVGI